MKISEKAYSLVRNKYLGMGTVISDEGCIAYRETVVETKNNTTITIYEEYGDDYMYITIFIKNVTGDVTDLEEYEVRI